MPNHVTLVLVLAAMAGLSARNVAAQPALVVLVRHAERDTAPAGDPGITTVGQQRARDLAAVLADTRVSVVVTTQFRRTQATAAPLLEKTGARSVVVRTGGPAAGHADSVAAVVRALPPGEAVLVVGHSNTIPPIIAALGGPRFPDLCDGQYSNLFVLVFSGTAQPRLIRSTFGVPDAPDAGACRTMRQP